MATMDRVCRELFTERGYAIFQSMTATQQLAVLRAFDGALEG